MDEVGKTAEGSPDRFVLLNGAIQAAEEGQNLPICFEAARQLAALYDVDELAMEVEAATKTFAGRASPELGDSETVDALEELAGRVVATDDFATAGQVQPLLQRASQSATDQPSKIELKNQAHEIAAYLEARAKVAPWMEKLKTLPNDPAANLAVGKFLCFQRGSWAAGVPLLARSGDPIFKDPATAELSVAADGDAKIALADKWFATACKLPATDRPKAMEHAAAIYRSAEAGLSGLQRMAVEKRLAKIPVSGQPRRVDLLKLFDPATNVVKGDWHMDNGVLVAEPVEMGRVEFAYQLPEEYDFRIRFTVTHMRSSIAQICCCNGHSFMYQLGSDNVRTGFEMVKGAGIGENKATQKKDQWIVEGRRYTSVVKIRKDGVAAYLDGQLVTSVKTDYSDMGIWPDWKLSRKNAVGIGQWKDRVRFDTVEIIAITGQGKVLSQ